MTLQITENPDGSTTATVETRDDILELRQREDFHEGAMSVLKYPSKAVGFFSHETGKAFGAPYIEAGDSVTKDAAGNFTTKRGGAA